MHHDAKRAVICIPIERMHMGDLNERQQRQQGNAHDRRYREASRI